MNLLTPFRRRSLALPDSNPLEAWVREIFEDGTRPLSRAEFPFVPAANVSETDKEWLVSMELPGMAEADVDVRLNGNQLIVSGERKKEKETKDKQYHRIESTYGAFERRFELPMDVRTDAEGVKASFQKGLLEIRIAKIEPKPMTKIQVKSS